MVHVDTTIKAPWLILFLYVRSSSYYINNPTAMYSCKPIFVTKDFGLVISAVTEVEGWRRVERSSLCFNCCKYVCALCNVHVDNLLDSLLQTVATKGKAYRIATALFSWCHSRHLPSASQKVNIQYRVLSIGSFQSVQCRPPRSSK